MPEGSEVCENVPSIEEVRAQLATISEALSWPLAKVLEHFKPGEDFAEVLEVYLPEWGEKSFHEFLASFKEELQVDQDLMNGAMKPFNLFLTLHQFYYY